MKAKAKSCYVVFAPKSGLPPVTVLALTKPNARGKAKRKLGLRRLPVKHVVRKIA